LAVEGRRAANATFGKNVCDTYTGLNYAMDLTLLIKNKDLDIAEYVCGYIDGFKNSVKNLLDKLQ